MCLAVSTSATLAGFVFLTLGPGRHLPSDLFGGAAGAAFLLMGLAFAAVGAIVATRLPEHPIGWIFCATGLLWSVGLFGYEYARYGLYGTSERLPGAAAGAWLQFVETQLVAGMVALSLLLFPDGRLPSRRWKPVAVVTVVGMAGVTLGSVLRPGPFDDPFAVVSNPTGVAGIRGVCDAVVMLGWLLMWGGMLAAAVSAPLRLRRAPGVERQQLKWVLAAGPLVAAAVVADMATWFIWPHGHLQARMAVIGVAFAVLPITAGIAILRYRLYDIDVVINRALVYAGLTATLAVAYLATVLLLELVLNGATGDSSLAVAISTLAVAALFRPARARIQTAVDRRFYRHRYDARRTLESFSTRLRDEIDLDTLGAAFGAVVTEALQPAHVSLWLRDPEVPR